MPQQPYRRKTGKFDRVPTTFGSMVPMAPVPAHEPTRKKSLVFDKRINGEPRTRDEQHALIDRPGGPRTVLDKPGTKGKPYRERKDINLTDEQKGKYVGEIDVADLPDGKGGTFRFSKQILGGDRDDPRWAEHRERTRKAKKKTFSTFGALAGGGY